MSIQFWQQGDVHWFILSALIILVSCLRLAVASAKREHKWRNSWVHPKVILEGFWAFCGIKPLLEYFVILKTSKGDLQSPSVFTEMHNLEVERFNEGLSETLLQLFLQFYVICLQVQGGKSANISSLSLFSLSLSIFSMSKTLLERHPARTRALSFKNMATLFLFVLAGVISRCVTITIATMLLPFGFALLLGSQFLLLIFAQFTVVEWKARSFRTPKFCVRKVADQESLATQQPMSSAEHFSVDLFWRVCKSSVITLFVFCPLSISDHINTIDIATESISLIALLWSHTLILVLSFWHVDDPLRSWFGYTLIACIGIQLIFLTFHNRLVKTIRFESEKFFSQNLTSKGTIVIPGEVDVDFVQDGRSLLMVAGELGNHALAHNLLSRGADPTYENEDGATVFSVSGPDFHKVLLSHFLDPEKSGVFYSEKGDLKVPDPVNWVFVEPYVTKGLNVSLLELGSHSLSFSATSHISLGSDKIFTQAALQCVEGSKVMKYLDLSQNHFNDEMCEILSLTISANTNLHFLNLSCCSFSDPFKVMKGVGSNRFLKHVDLSSTQMDTDQMFSLLDHMASNPNLEKLDLSSNKISTEDGGSSAFRDNFSRFFSCHPEIQLINFSENSLFTSPEIVDKIHAACKHHDLNCSLLFAGTEGGAKYPHFQEEALSIEQCKISKNNTDVMLDILTSAVEKHYLRTIKFAFDQQWVLVEAKHKLLEVACEKGKHDAVSLLLENDDEIPPSACNAALLSPDCSKPVLEVLFNRNAPFSFEHLNSVIELGQVQTLQMMAEVGFTFDCKDLDGNTLLHSAVEHNQSQTLEYLLQKIGSSAQTLNNEGLSPILLACKLRYFSLLDIFFSNHSLLCVPIVTKFPTAPNSGELFYVGFKTHNSTSNISVSLTGPLSATWTATSDQLIPLRPLAWGSYELTISVDNKKQLAWAFDVTRPSALDKGTRVKRGTDWKWENQDGGEGTVGTVLEEASEGWVRVKWCTETANNYRWGSDNCYDLEVVGSPLPIGTCVSFEQNVDGYNFEDEYIVSSTNANGFTLVGLDGKVGPVIREWDKLKPSQRAGSKISQVCPVSFVGCQKLSQPAWLCETCSQPEQEVLICKACVKCHHGHKVVPKDVDGKWMCFCGSFGPGHCHNFIEVSTSSVGVPFWFRKNGVVVRFLEKHQGYNKGSNYIVCNVDESDNTFQAVSLDGSQESWADWKHVELHEKQNALCQFALIGTRSLEQAHHWSCQTCNLSTICITCAQKCHVGHDLKPKGFSDVACSCGPSASCLCNQDPVSIYSHEGLPANFVRPCARQEGVRIMVHSNSQSYTIGRAYVVTHVDTDGTCKAVPVEGGQAGNWIRWKDVSLLEGIPTSECSFLGEFPIGTRVKQGSNLGTLISLQDLICVQWDFSEGPSFLKAGETSALEFLGSKAVPNITWLAHSDTKVQFLGDHTCISGPKAESWRTAIGQEPMDDSFSFWTVTVRHIGNYGHIVLGVTQTQTSGLDKMCGESEHSWGFCGNGQTLHNTLPKQLSNCGQWKDDDEIGIRLDLSSGVMDCFVNQVLTKTMTVDVSQPLYPCLSLCFDGEGVLIPNQFHSLDIPSTLAPQTRVSRAGESQNREQGTVTKMLQFSAVEVKWDSGATSLHKWGLDGQFELQVMEKKGDVPMEARKPGTVVVIKSNSNSHNYVIGQIYVVSEVDTDGTCKAEPLQGGSSGNWLKWIDAALVEKAESYELDSFPIGSRIKQGDQLGTVVLHSHDLVFAMWDFSDKLGAITKPSQVELVPGLQVIPKISWSHPQGIQTHFLGDHTKVLDKTGDSWKCAVGKEPMTESFSFWSAVIDKIGENGQIIFGVTQALTELDGFCGNSLFSWGFCGNVVLHDTLEVDLSDARIWKTGDEIGIQLNHSTGQLDCFVNQIVSLTTKVDTSKPLYPCISLHDESDSVLIPNQFFSPERPVILPSATRVRNSESHMEGVVLKMIRVSAVQVKWDSGDLSVHKWGVDGLFELEIIEKVVDFRQPGCIVRFLASSGPFESGEFAVVVEVDTDNTFKARKPKTKKLSHWLQWNSVEFQDLRPLKIGSQVRRGKDWQWGDQDGGLGGTGIVISDVQNGWVEVLWANGNVQNHRWTYDLKYDLEIVTRPLASVDNIKKERTLLVPSLHAHSLIGYFDEKEVGGGSATCDVCKVESLGAEQGTFWHCHQCGWDSCQDCVDKAQASR